jgi:hypothetical protein
MNETRRNTLAIGILLILLGGFFLAQIFWPGLTMLVSWPVIIIAVGAGLFLLGLIIRAPGMSVPAAIVAGIGGILYYQNQTGEWGSWSYMWALIPGFVGVGIIVGGLLGDKALKVADGLRQVVISLVLFLVFGAFFGGFRGLGDYWPLLLIGAGVILLILYFIPKRS